MATLISEQITITAVTLSSESAPITSKIMPVSKIETIEVIEQNKILENIIFFSLIGKVFKRLKNFPSREILFAQNEFNKIEYIRTEHKTISKSQLSIVNSFIIAVKMFVVTSTIRGKESTIAK